MQEKYASNDSQKHFCSYMTKNAPQRHLTFEVHIKLRFFYWISWAANQLLATASPSATIFWVRV